ncbi:unnamed protein product, partial [marine sediment metagenome]
CKRQIREWQQASVAVAWKKRKIAKLRASRNTQLASARVLLCVAMKKNSGKLPAWAVKALKEAWFAELQYYLQVANEPAFQAAFDEMASFLAPNNPAMRWTAGELQRIT